MGVKRPTNRLCVDRRLTASGGQLRTRHSSTPVDRGRGDLSAGRDWIVSQIIHSFENGGWLDVECRTRFLRREFERAEESSFELPS